MNKKKIKKYALIVAFLSIPFLCVWGYWEYLGYKFEQNPQYFYRPDPYIEFLQEWNKMLEEEDSINQDSLLSPPKLS